MMKIHTTQNLNSLEINQQPINSKVTRLNKLNSGLLASSYTNDVIFKAKKPNAKDIKIIADSSKKLLGDIPQKAQHEKRWYDKILMSSTFNFFAGLAKKNETAFQAVAAAIAGGVFRPTTILSMPTKTENDKTNNIYAACHAIASAIVGIFAVYAFNVHFRNGADKVIKNMLKELPVDRLKEILPHLDVKTLNSERILTTDGKKFTSDMSSCQMLKKFTHLAEMSEEGLKDLGAEVDWKKFKGQSLNKVTTIDGKPLVDVLDFNKLGIKFEFSQKSAKSKDSIIKSQILFRDMDRKFVEKMADEAGEKDLFNNIDINSVFDENGAVRHFKHWTKNGGKEKVKLDLNRVSGCSELESIDQLPRTNGALIYDEREGIYKLATFLDNGENGGLGTFRDAELIKAAKEFETLKKNLTWFPDLVARIPTAMLTIALIPKILKCFGIEKVKSAKPETIKSESAKQETVKPESGQTRVKNETNSKDPSFKGKGKPSKNVLSGFNKWWNDNVLDKIAGFMAKCYGEPLLKSKTFAKINSKLTAMTDILSQHMATVGSFIVSSVYVTRTLGNKEMDSDRKKTLAVNQALCFVFPTIGAYTIDSLLRNFVKDCDYRYKGLAKKGLDDATRMGDTKNIGKFSKMLNENSKGIRALFGLATFTLMYRYLTPVIITPIANKIGDKINEKAKAKQIGQHKIAS